MAQFPCTNPKCPNQWHRVPQCPNLPATLVTTNVGMTPPPPASRAASTEEPNESVSFTLPSFAIDDLKRKIEAKNHRLQAAGSQESFSVTFSDPFYTKNEDGIAIEEVRAFVNRPRIQSGPWSFVGALRQEDGGVLTHRFQDVDDMPTEITCDHCQSNRDRKMAYVIQHEEGDLMTLGSTCVQPFLGLSAPTPATLKLLEEDLEEDFYSDENRHRSQVAPIDDVLKTALALTGGGKNYLSFDKASYLGQSPTGHEVRDYLFGDDVLIAGKVAGGMASLAGEQDLDELVDEVKAAVRNDKSNSDYIRNLQTILDGNWVSKDSVSILASAVTVLNRPKAQEWTPGFVGNIGDKLPSQSVEIVGNRILKGYGFRGGDKSVVTMRTEDGKMMTFFASRVIDLKEGQRTTLKGGTVKSTGQYQGNDQTVIARARLEEG